MCSLLGLTRCYAWGLRARCAVTLTCPTIERCSVQYVCSHKQPVIVRAIVGDGWYPYGCVMAGVVLLSTLQCCVGGARFPMNYRGLLWRYDMGLQERA